MNEKLGLTPDQENEAIRLRKEHSDASWRLRFANTIHDDGYKGIEDTIEMARSIAGIHDDVDPIDEVALRKHPIITETRAHLDGILTEAQEEYDDNLALSRRHFNENRDAYIEQATMEATKAGVTINTPEARAQRKEQLIVEFREMFRDASLQTVSLRRHGRYDRDFESTTRGQLALDHLPELREIADDWVGQLPDDVRVRLIASPSEMPANAYDEKGKQKFFARARTTAAFYGAALRKRFGRDYEFHDDAEAARADAAAYMGDRGFIRSHRDQKDYSVDRNIGDILEFVDFEAGQSVKPFFDELGKTYGKLSPEFWHDYIRGELPATLNEVLLANGGMNAVEKSKLALELIMHSTEASSNDAQKNVELVVSHEEVIGSLAYQIAQYLRETKGAELNDIKHIESIAFGYNEGIDMHIADDGTAMLRVGNAYTAIDLEKFATFLGEKLEQ